MFSLHNFGSFRRLAAIVAGLAVVTSAGSIAYAEEDQTTYASAEEAVRLYRKLAEGNPAAFEPALATARRAITPTRWAR